MGRCRAGGAWMPDGWGPLVGPGGTLGACLLQKPESLSSQTADLVVMVWRMLTSSALSKCMSVRTKEDSQTTSVSSSSKCARKHGLQR